MGKVPIKPNYGVDAPVVIRNLSILSVVMLILSIISFWLFQGDWRWLGLTLSVIFGITFLIGLLEGIYMYWSSKVGKLRERERLLDLITFQGNEKVLDIGCGRGLVMNATARRLITGRVFGMDIWNSYDQSGNHPDVTRKNAKIEGVAEKIEIVTGDARRMPFDKETFDVVVSSLAIHNIYDREERCQALGEVLRVLKPGGQFAILDFQHVKEYLQIFKEFEVTDVKLVGPHYLMFPPIKIVTGRKLVQ
ncbi:type 11 methyltransferase [Bacillus sp. J14TS2]|uniref:class I SAM-dependent methyltransferase n=1 Tax=Bacillus sp. J14TS2 TaxID=2807188 RepID=UPI001B0806F2|nr:class I SAM-dependent methyltransferase [Bacillus sp. J14TS2]GIN74274.1 type 11 methyltransferase [Bacillus sp. J14TS2]